MASLKMVGTLELNKEKTLVWKIQTPTWMSPCVSSPIFSFQNRECYFELLWRFPKYEIYIQSKDQQGLPQNFDVTVSVQCLLETINCSRTSVNKITKNIIGFDFPAIFKKFSDKNFEKSECVCINVLFHGDLPLSLSTSKGSHAQKSSSCCPHSYLESLSHDFGRLLDEDSCYDVELKCSESSFKAHRNILSIRSPVFKEMLQNDRVESQRDIVEGPTDINTPQTVVKIEDMDSYGLRNFVRYLYTGIMPGLTINNAKHFYEVGDKFKVESLRKRCADFLSENLSQNNACEILIWAEDHSDEHLKDNVIDYILEKKIPLQDNQWNIFCRDHPKLGVEVLTRAYKSQTNI